MTEKNIIELKVQSVIFDMDGVITHTMPYHFSAWQSVMSDEGIDVSEYEVYSREGQKGIESIMDFYSQNNIPCSTEKAKALLTKKETLFKKIVKNQLIDGSEDFVCSLNKSDFRLGLVTGTAHHEIMKILPQHLFKMFEVVISGSDVTIGKPDPGPYLLALKRFNISPTDACVIENAPYGIRSAKAAGLTCLALETSLPAEYLTEADHIFSSVADMRKKVQFYNTLIR